MICPKCGKEIPGGATFCPNCGSSLEGIQKTDTTETIVGNVEKVAKKTSPIYFIVGGAVLAVLITAIIIAIIISNTVGKTVNLNDYVTVSFDGYNSRGTAKVDFDKDSFEKKYGDKIKVKNTGDFWSSLFSPSDLFLSLLSYDLDKSKDLSNGDVVTLTWNVDSEEYKKTFGLKVKSEDMTFMVANLEEIGTFDPFEGIEVSFSGIGPNGNAKLTDYPSDNGLHYEIKNAYNLSNGDTVTVQVSYGWISEDSYIEKYGKIPSSMTKDFVVEGLDEYISSYTDIDAILIDDMRTQAQDVICSYVAKTYNGGSKMTGLQYAGYVFCGTEVDKNYWSTHNMLYLIYKGEVSNENGDFVTAEVYYPVRFDNFLKNAEGIYASSCAGIRGSSSFSNSRYTTLGYINPFQAYLELGVGNQDNYIIECGDGFETFSQYEAVSSISDIDELYLKDLEENATDIVLKYMKDNYSAASHVDELSLKGYYLLTRKEQIADFANNNTLLVVLTGYLYNDNDKFEGTNVYFPVEFDGLVKLPNKWMFTRSSGLQGKSRIGDSVYTTHGYTDGEKMFNDLVTANRDKYTFDVSDGLKEFGE